MGARLGQHFLLDPAILGRIADAAILAPDERVLEIGPGKGTLTRALASRAASVTCIEMDQGLAAELQVRAAGARGAGSVTVISGDALKVPWPEVDVIAGNIPYQITSPLIEKALTPPRPRRIVFLIQREVADRLAARAGDGAYGALSAGVQLVAEVERLFAVKAGAFRPPPRVESAVVRITPRAEPLAANEPEEARAREMIRALFQRRRNQIQRSIREFTGLLPATVVQRLEAAGIGLRARPEELTPVQFVTLARLFPTA